MTKKRNILAGIGIAAALVGGVIISQPSQTKNPRTSKELFDVVDVVDGDTIKVNNPEYTVTNGKAKTLTIRLIGINTPETKDPRKPVECFGKEASENARKQLAGQKVYFEYDNDNSIDKYNRELAYVYRSDGYFYNLQAVADGFGYSYRSYPHPKLKEFNEAEKMAKDSQKGLWSPSTCNGLKTPVNDKK